MNTDHKLRQEMYHTLNETDDSIDDKFWMYVISDSDRLVIDIEEYFTIPVDMLIYPSKSYAVAIIYARLLRIYFKVPVLESLADPMLLYGNDRFFRPYTKQTSDVYNRVIFTPFDENLPQVAKTIEYFREEFFLNPNPYFTNSDLA